MIRFFQVLVFAVFVFLPALLTAQDDQPGYYVDSTGQLFWNRNLPVYLRISPSPQDTGVVLKSQKQAQYTNPYYLDNEGKNEIRTYYATDPETGKRTNPPIEVNWEVYADGRDPESASSYYGASSYASEAMQYFSKGLKISIDADDATAGVKKLVYAMDGQNFTNYTGPLEIKEEGRHQLQYYATDFVGNAEKKHNEEFVVDLKAPETQHELKGIAFKDVIGDSSVLFLDVKDDFSGIRNSWYRINDEEERKYNGEAISVAGYKNGSYTLYYYSVDNVGNRGQTRTFNFYLDKIPPILAADVLGDRFIVDDQIYFSGRTKLKLTAVDNKSGVKHLKYSVDYEEFKEYEKPFYLPSEPGTHVVRYYAVDEMGNATEDIERVQQRYYEFKHNVRKIYVDLTGPTLSHDFLGEQIRRGDTLFISPETRLQLQATDGESGMKEITYSLDGQQEEISYGKPFPVKSHGWHDAEYFGYDKVNNRNTGEFSFFVDARPPAIQHYFSVEAIGSKDGHSSFPSYVELFVSATDRIIGTDEIYYSVNGGSERLYRGKIAGFEQQAVNEVQLRAVDSFGNVRKTSVKFYVASKKGQ